MMKDDELVVAGVIPGALDVEEVAAPDATVSPGQWYWMTRKDPGTYWDRDLGDQPIPRRELLCVIGVGSNYAELESVNRYTYRVHFSDFQDRLEFEPDPQSVWSHLTNVQRLKVAGLMAEIKELTVSLGLTGTAMTQGGETQALSKLGDVDTSSYRSELAKTKDGLPELFKSLEGEHRLMARYMTAGSMAMKAQAISMGDIVEAIDDRVLNIDLYAGLSEDVKTIRGGDPAAFDEKLAVRQRMLYMDEECLPFYKSGGMTFRSIGDFDKWISAKSRFTRLLPEARCVVAFRVRRSRRRWDGEGGIRGFINFWSESRDDTRTFLYVRNGDQLHRLETDFDFGPNLFPDSAGRRPDEELMMTESTHPDFVTRREFDEMDPEQRDRWVPFAPESVYYDDADAILRRKMLHYNRVAMILQGLFDRSGILHPHPPVKTWTADGFDRAIRLVFDNDHALAPADMPNFQDSCNASLSSGSVTCGQRDSWLAHLQDTYGSRFDDKLHGCPWSLRSPGLGHVARVYKWHPRTKHCSYRWSRQTDKFDRALGEWRMTAANYKAEASSVFNLDGYRAGDFKKFYDDPRTRLAYLDWAKFLLTGEDYAAGKLTIHEPNTEWDRKR